ncbi:MAG: TIR domain-containing protein [Alphaproteobacteria bacterium]|nr:TIR domain-containing protein [Alphaproteobacteria bacterium]
MADFIFIYAPEDSGRVRDVAEALAKRGITASTDRSIPAGQRYDVVMADRLQAAKAVVIVWSEAALRDPKLIDEAAAARDQGKAAPVRIAPVEPPLGFRQLQTADLSEWGRPSADSALHMLAAALIRARDGDAAAPVALARPVKPFVRTAKFWLFSLALALAIGALFFISPEVREALTADPSAMSRGTLLGLYLGVCFVLIALARLFLHLSRLVVGRTTKAYFSREFLIFMGAALIGAVAMGATGGFGSGAEDAPRASFLTGLASGLALLPLLISLGLLLFRGMRRLLLGRVKAD